MKREPRKQKSMFTLANVFYLLVCCILAAPAWAGYSLNAKQEKVLRAWLDKHPEYRQAADADCQCPEDIKLERAGSGGVWKPVPDYHPYVVTGDFNDDGVEDFAVVVIDRSKKEKQFALLIFNGPFKRASVSPAFFEPGLELKQRGLDYGPPRPKPYRLVLGPFEAEGQILTPTNGGYKLVDDEL